MKTKLAKASLNRETLVRLEEMPRVHGGALRLHELHAAAQIDATRPFCLLSQSC